MSAGRQVFCGVRNTRPFLQFSMGHFWNSCLEFRKIKWIDLTFLDLNFRKSKNTQNHHLSYNMPKKVTKMIKQNAGQKADSFCRGNQTHEYCISTSSAATTFWDKTAASLGGIGTHPVEIFFTYFCLIHIS